MTATFASLRDQAPADYQPTEADWQNYEAHLTTVNLVDRLRAAKPHILHSDWVTLMAELGTLSSHELRQASTRTRPVVSDIGSDPSVPLMW